MGRVVTTKHASAEGAWELAVKQPAPALQSLLREPYYGYVEQTRAPLRRREYPGVQVVMIVDLGPPIALISPRRSEQVQRFARGFVAGLSQHYTLTEHAGVSAGIQINLRPTSARRLFGLPMAQLTDRIVALSDLLTHDECTLIDRMFETACWERRFALLDQLLIGRLLRAQHSDLGIAQALRAIERDPNGVDMAKLAQELGCSHKQMIARFRDQAGMAPKLIARVARFEHAIKLMGDSDANFAELARRAGYFDQAHLARDFREFAGSTPTEVRSWLQGTGLPAELGR